MLDAAGSGNINMNDAVFILKTHPVYWGSQGCK